MQNLALEPQGATGRRAAKQRALRRNPYALIRVENNSSYEVVFVRRTETVIVNGATPGIQPRDAARGAAHPDRAIRARSNGAHLGSAEALPGGPPPQDFAIGAEFLQAAFGADPERTRAVPMNGLAVAPGQTLGRSPGLPFLIAEPAGEAGARESHPHGAFTVLQDA